MGKCSLLILTVGIPGAGKSYWVREYLRTHPLTYVVSTDDIRKELTGEEQCIDPSQNEMIHNEARNRVKKILEDPNSRGGFGPEIIVDSTNCDVEEWKAYKELQPTIMVARLFNAPPWKAYDNIKNRERKVGLEILEMKWARLQKSRPHLSKYFNMIITS